MKKFTGGTIILDMQTKNHNHMITVPKIQSETDIIFCHFGPFFALLSPPPSLPLHPNDLKIQKSKFCMKKMPGDIILLYIHVYHK